MADDGGSVDTISGGISTSVLEIMLNTLIDVNTMFVLARIEGLEKVTV
jgi:hypothetical protein